MNLPQILSEQNLQIIEMKSEDDSLDSVFEKLMQFASWGILEEAVENVTSSLTFIDMN